MNWYGNSEKDNLLEEIVEFLNNHPISELLNIVSTAVERKEEN